MYDNHIMTGSAASPLRRLLKAPFTKRAWVELGYTLVSVPLAVAGFIFTVVRLPAGILWAATPPTAPSTEGCSAKTCRPRRGCSLGRACG